MPCKNEVTQRLIKTAGSTGRVTAIPRGMPTAGISKPDKKRQDSQIFALDDDRISMQGCRRGHGSSASERGADEQRRCAAERSRTDHRRPVIETHRTGRPRRTCKRIQEPSNSQGGARRSQRNRGGVLIVSQSRRKPPLTSGRYSDQLLDPRKAAGGLGG